MAPLLIGEKSEGAPESPALPKLAFPELKEALAIVEEWEMTPEGDPYVLVLTLRELFVESGQHRSDEAEGRQADRR